MTDISVVRPTTWTFLTNHSHVLLAIYRNPDLRQRDIAHLVGITEGAVQRILHELEADGYLDIRRVGRCNHYTVHPDLGLRHPLEAGHTIGEVLERLAPLGSETEHRQAALAATAARSG
ncbi:MAG: helix-turn-helix domain-containing protein [Actinomycetota bacterium]